MSVGKSSLIHRYTKGNFFNNTIPTIVTEIATKIIKLKNGTKAKALIWDTAGQEKYRSLINQHYRMATGALIVYDVTNKESFQTCQKFLYDIKQYCEPDCVVYLVGNKVDLLESKEYERAVNLETVETFCSENQLKYIETSAYSQTNVNNTFLNLLEDVDKVQKSSNVKNDIIGQRPIRIKEKVKQQENTEGGECPC